KVSYRRSLDDGENSTSRRTDRTIVDWAGGRLSGPQPWPGSPEPAAVLAASSEAEPAPAHSAAPAAGFAADAVARVAAFSPRRPAASPVAAGVADVPDPAAVEPAVGPVPAVSASVAVAASVRAQAPNSRSRARPA